MIVHSLHYSPVEWVADRLAARRHEGPDRALVLCPNRRLAHAVRRAVAVDRRRPESLAGVTFLRPAEAAHEILARSGAPRRAGWEAARQGRLLHLLVSGAVDHALHYFRPDRLRGGQGYTDAVATAIADLEAAGLDPHTLSSCARSLDGDPRSADRLTDLAILWRLADEAQGDRRSEAQLLREATATLRQSASRSSTPSRRTSTARRGQLTFDELLAQPTSATRHAAHPWLARFEPVIAILERSPDGVLLPFLEACGNVELVLQDARPLRTGTQRWRERLTLGAPVPVCETETSELALVRRYLFEIPENLTDPDRTRSQGPDGSVDLEEHAGVDEEIEASAIWVAEQIAADIALEDIALLVPERGPYAALLADRLARLTHGDAGDVAVYIAGGLPLAECAAGKRLLALLATVRGGLELEAMLRLLPMLRRRGQAVGETASRLSPSRGRTAIYDAGIHGGGSGNRDGIAAWRDRLRRHADRLGRLVDAAETQPPADHQRNEARRWLRDVAPLIPAVERLVDLALHIHEGTPFHAAWPVLAELCASHLTLPPDPPNLAARLTEIVEPWLTPELLGDLPCGLGLAWIADRLQRERVAVGRFGEPRVFIGTPAQAAGLSFEATRILGLSEGGLPRTPHDDPIVPDELRARLAAALQPTHPDIVLPGLADHVLDDLHAVFRCVSGTGRRLALSVPRQWIDRSEREISGIVLEVATALARPGVGVEGDVPTAGRLRAAYFTGGNAARAEALRAWPMSPRAALARVAGHAPRLGGYLPEAWLGDDVLSLRRMRQLAEATAGAAFAPIDGALGAVWQDHARLGSEHKPMSASSLQLLLGCPHRFLLERVLHLKEPTPRLNHDSLDPITYGNLFHRIAETFLQRHGRAVCSREASLEHWQARAGEIVDLEFDRVLDTYPLRGADAAAREHRRLREQIDCLVRDEWHRPRRTFVASEHTFGRPHPVALACDEHSLHVHGTIDRIDLIGADQLSLRDLKTGRVRDLGEEDINLRRDLQLGLYTLVLEAQAAADGEAARVVEASYVHPSPAQEPERAFRAALLDGLRRRTTKWLALAAGMLAAGSFVRTPNEDDCRLCPFLPACGNGARERSARKLVRLPQTDLLAAFAGLERSAGAEGE